MKSLLPFLIALLAMPLPGHAASEASRPVYIIPIRDEIEPSMVYVVRRGMREAVENNAQAIILDMNTPGGRMDSMEEIMELLESFKGDTITYVNKKALSAGAFIATSTKRIYMAPFSTIGAASPVMMTGEDIPSTLKKKIFSYSAARLRASAQRHGHNPDVVEAMVKDDGLVVEGVVIEKKGALLTLTDTEAVKRYGRPPKPLLAEGIANDRDDLLAKLGFSHARIKTVEPTGAERLARVITMIAPLLLLIGIAGIYLEFKMPGVSLPGIIGVAALVIFFFGHYVAGLSGFEELLLFFFGVILVGVEIFLLPGHVLPGFLGVVCIMVSLLWAMVDKLPGAPAVPTLPQIQLPLVKLGGSMIGAAILVAILLRFLPKMSGPYGGLVLRTQMNHSRGFASASEATELVGKKGVALSMLRPSGTARFGERTVDVITQGEFISPNQAIEVVEVHGAQVLVRKAGEPSGAAPRV